MKIETPITRLLGIDLPILQAGMSWASSSSALPIAVTRAGGLGVVAAGPMYLDALEDTIDEVRAATDLPFGVNVPLNRRDADAVLELLLRKRVPVLITAQGGPPQNIDAFRRAGICCLHVVAGVKHALNAREKGVDGLIAVGAEAGGHPPPDLVTTLVLVRAVARAMNESIPLVAAGGFVDGAGLAAALSLGAHAVSFGTRFLATVEATVHDHYKRRVISASVHDTRTVGRDLGMVRVLKNDFAAQMLALEVEGRPLDERRAVFLDSTLKQAALGGDVTTGKVEAGQSAGLVADIRNAGDLVTEIAREYEAALRALPTVAR